MVTILIQIHVHERLVEGGCQGNRMSQICYDIWPHCYIVYSLYECCENTVLFLECQHTTTHVFVYYDGWVWTIDGLGYHKIIELIECIDSHINAGRVDGTRVCYKKLNTHQYIT